MKTNMRSNLPGSFLARDLEDGAWRLSRCEPWPIEVFLRGAESAAAQALRSSQVRDIDIEWCAESVLLTVTSAEHRTSIHAQNAIVHEPLAHLYEALPLASLDDKAMRFWRRVFRLVRTPGGGYLLGVLARRSRRRR